MGGSSSKFDEKDVPSLEKKTVVMTGANSGIGFEATKIFASKGADVVMMGRSKERLEKAAEEVRKAAADGSDGKVASKVEIEICDLSSQKSVREAAARVIASHPDGVDVLVNNAGVMATPTRIETEDGFEMQMATNHYGHFTLTSMLLPLLAKRPGSRVVSVSSAYHTMGNTTEKGIVLEDMHAEKSYDRWMQYRCTKFANVLFTKELQRRLEAAGLAGDKGVTAVACHPGYSATRLQREVTGGSIANALVAQSQYMGSLPTAMACFGDVPPASYIGPPGLSGYPQVLEADKRTDDPETARALWEHSVAATKASWELLGASKAPATGAAAPAAAAAGGGGGGVSAGESRS